MSQAISLELENAEFISEDENSIAMRVDATCKTDRVVNVFLEVVVREALAPTRPTRPPTSFIPSKFDIGITDPGCATVHFGEKVENEAFSKEALNLFFSSVGGQNNSTKRRITVLVHKQSLFPRNASSLDFNVVIIQQDTNGNTHEIYQSVSVGLMRKERGWIGAYSPEMKKKRIQRFHAKRKKHVRTKRVKYASRQKDANSRPRDKKGRFTKNENGT